MASMKQWYQNTGMALGLAAALGGMAGCKKKQGPEIPSFVEGTVLEDKLYSHPGVGGTYVLKVEAEEPSFEGKPIPRTYTFLLRNGSAQESTPIEVLNEAIFPGTKVIFQYRDEKNSLMYPVDGFGPMSASKLQVLRPFEDSRAVLAGLDGKAKLDYEFRFKGEQERSRREAAEIYKGIRKPKE